MISPTEQAVVLSSGRPNRAVLWAFGLLGLLFVASYLQLFTYFWHRWTEEHGPFGFGYFVPPSVAFLLWCNRDRIREAPVSKAPTWAWVLTGLVAMVNLVALVAAINLLQSLTFLALLMLVPLCIWGPVRYKYLWAALLYSATMIPWPGQIINVVLFKMQHLSIVIAVKMFSAMGLSPYVDGVMVMLPQFSFDVAPACAGLTILFPTVACTILTAMMVEAPLVRRLALIALSVPVSILTNAARIMLVGIIGNQGGTELANRLHDASGFVGVVICVLILSGLGSMIGCGKYQDRYMPAWAREPNEEGDGEGKGDKELNTQGAHA